MATLPAATYLQDWTVSWRYYSSEDATPAWAKGTGTTLSCLPEQQGIKLYLVNMQWARHAVRPLTPGTCWQGLNMWSTDLRLLHVTDNLHFHGYTESGLVSQSSLMPDMFNSCTLTSCSNLCTYAYMWCILYIYIHLYFVFMYPYHVSFLGHIIT